MMDDYTYTGRGLSFFDALYAAGQAAAFATTSSLATAGGALLGLNTARVARMVIWHENTSPMVFSERIDVLFNPSRVSLTNGIGCRARQHASPGEWTTELQVSSADYQPASLSPDFMFDTTDEGYSLWAQLADAASGGLAQALAAPTGTNVLSHTQKIARLAQPTQELHRPPLCQLWWGPYMLMQGALTQVSQEFKLWKPDGTPVRAVLNCSFTEFEQDSFEFHSPDVEKTHTVRRGDTLPAIASTYYGDASKWWQVAQFNGLEDARALVSGTVLRVPALER
ncbi:MAG: LysM peptidoglycan-binding domain-containing protein [Myxococcales bacterium]|nr:LysM peptidoglycan-binding domain-containing protein [Myxococcales bacterium]